MMMSQPNSIYRRCLAAMIVTCLLAGLATTAQTQPSIVPGIDYVHERTGDEPWSIHIVKVDRADTGFRMMSSLAQGHIYGLAPLSEQIQTGGGNPIVAVNGDFFHIRPGPYQGDPIGLQIVNGQLVSSPTGASFWIDPQGQPHIGPVNAKFRVTGLGGKPIPFGLNEKRADDTAVLYTPRVGPSTRTSAGLELVLAKHPDHDWLPLRVGTAYVANVSEVNETGDAPLSPETMVLSIGPKLAQTLPRPAPGDTVTLYLETSPDLGNVTTALAGGPVLIDNGKARTWEPPRPRHPRTAIGWNREQLFLVVVDGRQAGLSVGMTLPELAALMKRLGCTEAMNFDGGGSSTLWLGGRVMNSPSDGRERPVANGLMIVSTQKRSP